MGTILVAVDGTQRGLETVSILGRLLKDQQDLRIVLFHCVQQIATLLPGDICRDVEESCRLPFEDQEKVGRAVLDASLGRLRDAGFPEANVDSRLKLDSLDPATDIIAQAEAERIRTIVVGRRGRSQVEALLLGSISSKVAQYARDKAVWIIDTPVNDSMKTLIAMEGLPEVRALSYYTAELFGACPGMTYTFMHIIPPIPPTFWDDGHILSPAEQTERQKRIEKWRSEWTDTVRLYMSEGRDLLMERGVSDQSVESLILNAKEGIARDLLNEIEAHKFQIVVMGKRSFHERKPFLMGSHASKLLQNTKGVILCMVG
ncbi:MAG TPA: universal stress protein [Syntrophobacteraceae bacterium]|nr:universal stress protein [Syntrophobacteraceae bacterium]